MVLYHFELFGMACDLWPLRQNFTSAEASVTRDSGQISARPGILKLEFSANALSQLAKDNVTRDYTPISAPSKEPVTRATPNNLKWYSILLSDLFDDIYKFINLHLGAVFFFLLVSS